MMNPYSLYTLLLRVLVRVCWVFSVVEGVAAPSCLLHPCAGSGKVSIIPVCSGHQLKILVEAAF